MKIFYFLLAFQQVDTFQRLWDFGALMLLLRKNLLCFPNSEIAPTPHNPLETIVETVEKPLYSPIYFFCQI